jgi:hypothetical protein
LRSKPSSEIAQEQRKANVGPARQDLEHAHHRGADDPHGHEERGQHGEQATHGQPTHADGEQAEPREGQESAHGKEDLQHPAVVAIFRRQHPAQEQQDAERHQRGNQAHASPREGAGGGQTDEALAQIHGKESR